MNKVLASAVLVVALTAGACGDDDDDDAAASTTTTTEARSPTTETPPQSTTTTSSGPTLRDAADTARAWIAEVSGGDDEDAIALTSSRSLEAIGGPDGFRAREIELAEGWGAWDSAEEMQVTAIPIDDETAVVVLHGLVAQEGPPAESWAAMPVVATADGDRVEPFLDLGNVEADPPGNSTIPATGTLAAFALGGREMRFIVDAGDAMTPEIESADGDQQRGEIGVADLAPGSHALTVVLTNDDGVMARTFIYRVEA